MAGIRRACQTLGRAGSAHSGSARCGDWPWCSRGREARAGSRGKRRLCSRGLCGSRTGRTGGTGGASAPCAPHVASCIVYLCGGSAEPLRVVRLQMGLGGPAAAPTPREPSVSSCSKRSWAGFGSEPLRCQSLEPRPVACTRCLPLGPPVVASDGEKPWSAAFPEQRNTVAQTWWL